MTLSAAACRCRVHFGENAAITTDHNIFSSQFKEFDINKV